MKTNPLKLTQAGNGKSVLICADEIGALQTALEGGCYVIVQGHVIQVQETPDEIAKRIAAEYGEEDR
jgi:hypothetical protein